MNQANRLKRRTPGLVWYSIIGVETLDVIHPNFPNAPHGSVILIAFDKEKSTKFRGCSARESDFLRYKDHHDEKNATVSNVSASKTWNFEDVPHGSAILLQQGCYLLPVRYGTPLPRLL